MLYKGDTLYLDWLEDGIAELVFDAPGSVNKLDTATVASLGHALDVLEKQSDLKGLLLRSEKAAFIVGGGGIGQDSPCGVSDTLVARQG